MAKERKPKTSKNQNVEDKVVAQSPSTPSTMARKSKGP
jgi:hypothetical protein